MLSDEMFESSEEIKEYIKNYPDIYGEDTEMFNEIQELLKRMKKIQNFFDRSV